MNPINYLLYVNIWFFLNTYICITNWIEINLLIFLNVLIYVLNVSLCHASVHVNVKYFTHRLTIHKHTYLFLLHINMQQQQFQSYLRLRRLNFISFRNSQKYMESSAPKLGIFVLCELSDKSFI